MFSDETPKALQLMTATFQIGVISCGTKKISTRQVMPTKFAIGATGER